MFKDNKGVLKSRKSKEDRQCNGKKKKSNDLQNNTQKTEDRVTGTPLWSRSEHMCSGGVSIPCSTCGTLRFSVNHLNIFIHSTCKREITLTSVLKYILSYERKV